METQAGVTRRQGGCGGQGRGPGTHFPACPRSAAVSHPRADGARPGAPPEPLSVAGCFLPEEGGLCEALTL